MVIHPLPVSARQSPGGSQLRSPHDSTTGSFSWAFRPGIRLGLERPLLHDRLHHRQGIRRCIRGDRGGVHRARPSLQDRSCLFEPDRLALVLDGCRHTLCEGCLARFPGSLGTANRMAPSLQDGAAHPLLMLGYLFGCALLAPSVSLLAAMILSLSLALACALLFLRSKGHQWQSALSGLGGVLWLLNITLYLHG